MIIYHSSIAPIVDNIFSKDRKFYYLNIIMKYHSIMVKTVIIPRSFTNLSINENYFCPRYMKIQVFK
jgi:hypothetical protein